MQPYAEGFYKSQQWRDCRISYLKTVGYKCENCLAKGIETPAVIVHLKVFYTINKTYVIETYVGTRQPVYKMQKVTEMNDTSYFCQRSSYYYSGQEHWGNWYKFTGEAFTLPTGR